MKGLHCHQRPTTDMKGLHCHQRPTTDMKGLHCHQRPTTDMKGLHCHQRPTMDMKGLHCQSRAVHGSEGSPLSLLPSPAVRMGQCMPTMKEKDLHHPPLPARPSDVALRLSHGGEGPSSSMLSSRGSHGSEGTIHGDIRTIHGDTRTIHGGDGTIHGDNMTIQSDIVTIHGDSDPSSSPSSWATCATTKEVLQLHMATTTTLSLPSQEILKVHVEDSEDDNNDDDSDNNNEGPTQIMSDDTNAPPAMLLDPPAIFYIKPELATTTVTTPDIPTPPSWMPVDPHGSKLPCRSGHRAHAPVRPSTTPDHGKRLVAQPKHKRHIRLGLGCGRSC
nr:uncharacterized protein LOC116807445 [Taeniopygia guttata]